jgi:hypothetical protein
MTAQLATSTNITNGLREFSDVTNTFGGYIISAGAAYNLTTPFQADKFEWFNYTEYATNSQMIQGVWFRDFPSAAALIINRGTTTLTSTQASTNGVTIANVKPGFVSENQALTNITTATPAVVTVSSTAAYTTGDRVIITKVAGNMGSEVNNKEFVINVINSTTFSLYDIYGIPFTTLATYTSGGSVNLEGPSLGIVNSPGSFILTLGTDIMGSSADVIYFQATQMNGYFNFGTA